MTSKKSLFKEIRENIEAELNRGYRDGIEIEKGVVVNEDYLKKNKKQLGHMFSIFSAYPDIFLDFITPVNSNFTLFFYQRIVLRAIMRYRDIFITAPRAFSKTFITILGLFLQCIFMPGTKRFICAPNKNQSAQIAREKMIEIYDRWPLLKREVLGGEVSDLPGSFGKDYVSIKFRNGSVFDVVGALDSTRGGRRHGGLIDEVRDHEEEPINNVVLPLMNVSRRLPDNTVNENEPNQERIFMTSAGVKTSFAYDLLLDIFEDSIIHPESSFCLGCDYRVPLLHGLLDKTYINKLKTSPSFSETSFSAEYLSIWSGSSSDSWFNFDKMQKYRKIKNPENHAKYESNSHLFYLISVDVGRLNDQTVATIFRVNISEEGRYYATVVNLKVLARQAETKTFTQQAIDIKKLIFAFNPIEVVIDTNGLGIGLADEMIKPQYDNEGNYYPPFGFVNDERYFLIQPKDCQKVLYSLKANGQINSKIHGNAFSRLNGGMVRFLIKEQEAKTALLSTKKGQKMSTLQKVERIMPHEMTTRLFEEMANLRIKRTGVSTDIVLEQINPRFPKDKYSSFAYGLWRIKEREEEANSKKRRRESLNGHSRKLTFFN